MEIYVDENGSGDNNHPSKEKRNLIVNYIPQYATEEDLSLIFAKIGKIESIKIMRDFRSGYSYGFGFVTYSTPDEAAKAIEELNGMSYGNKRLKVSFSRPPGTNMKNSNLYVTNLPLDMTVDDVDKIFGVYGEIVQRTVLRNKHTGSPRGIAFVRFATGDQAKDAIVNLNGKILGEAGLPLSVRVAEDYGRQQAQYLNVYNTFSQDIPVRAIVPFWQLPVNVIRAYPVYRCMRYNSNMRNMAAGDYFPSQHTRESSFFVNLNIH